MKIPSDEFKTNLGTVKTWIESDVRNLVVISKNNYLIINSHKITLQKLELFNDWLKPNIDCESSVGWRWFIEKIDNKDESLTLFCELIYPQPNISIDGDSGEWLDLDAVEVESKTHHLHIGTEDGEIMRSRAINDDFIPQRFEEILGFDGTGYSFTEYTDFGFKTNIPKLLKNEKIYFHFLIATNPIKISEDNPKYEDISTWFAVDWLKEDLDKYIKFS